MDWSTSGPFNAKKGIIIYGTAFGNKVCFKQTLSLWGRNTNERIGLTSKEIAV